MMTEERFKQRDTDNDGAWTRTDGFGARPELDANSDGSVSAQEFSALRCEMALHMFVRMDVNNDKVLQADELSKAASDERSRRVGPRGRALLAPQEADADGDGQVTLSEFVAAHAKAAADAFKELDADGNGLLQGDEIPRLGPGGGEGEYPPRGGRGPGGPGGRGGPAGRGDTVSGSPPEE